MDPQDATKLSGGVTPYDVNSPLWSDGATKERALAIPDNGFSVVSATNQIDLGRGSVVLKTFSLGGRRVETRMLMHDDDGWAGYSYEWNDDQTDAALLEDGKTIMVAGQAWTFPSRSQCFECHGASGEPIGLQLAQLNRDFTYPSTGRTANQLSTLSHIGIISNLSYPDQGGKLANPAFEEAPLVTRARSYLHANCACCHQPGGAGQGTMDLRFDTYLADTQTCNAAPTVTPRHDAPCASAKLAPRSCARIEALRHRPVRDRLRREDAAAKVFGPDPTSAWGIWARATARFAFGSDLLQ